MYFLSSNTVKKSKEKVGHMKRFVLTVLLVRICDSGELGEVGGGLGEVETRLREVETRLRGVGLGMRGIGGDEDDIGGRLLSGLHD